MRDPEEIAADLERWDFSQGGEALYTLLREAAEALREQEAAIESAEAENVMAQAERDALYEQSRRDAMALGEAMEIEAERDALIAYVRGLFEIGSFTRAYLIERAQVLPESVRRKIEQP